MLHSPAKSFALVAACLLLLASTSTLHAERTASATTPKIPAVLLVPPTDKSGLDTQIRASQLRLAQSAAPGAELEKLGWLLIAKARASSDPGFYTLAALTADTLEREFELLPPAWLLRGHVLQTRHRFAEAVVLAKQLVAVRGSAADYALLGDALYDLGQINDAASAYQRMVDLKPSQDSYARAANIRWIKGDLTGAIELQTMAVRSGGPADRGATAWNLCRLAQLIWQQGNTVESMALTARALELLPEFQPALLLKGKLLLASGSVEAALIPLARAAELLPLPEPYWVYADALRAVGRGPEAADIEARLIREGSAEDPRTVALFLATRGNDLPTAVQLATAELSNRADIMTHSTAALALAQAGRIPEAIVHQQAALAEGTDDPRLLLHAGRVAALAHQPHARELLERAQLHSAQLLPSERQLLEDSFSLPPANSVSKGDANKTTHQNPT